MRLAAAVLVPSGCWASRSVPWGAISRPSNADAQRLVAAVTVMAEMAGDPSTHEMVLHDQAGVEAGMALMSTHTHELAIFSTSLVRPTRANYDCYLERAGGAHVDRADPLADGVTFWTGPMGDDTEFGQPGDLLVVAADEQAPAMLSASSLRLASSSAVRSR